MGWKALCPISALWIPDARLLRMDMGTLFVFFSFHICVIYASAFQQVENGLTPRPITTAPPKLDDRDTYVSTICGFFYDSAMSISAFLIDIP